MDIKNNTKSKAKYGALLAGMIALAGLTASTSAFATGPLTCSPNLMEYSSGTLIVQCSGTNYYATTAAPPSGCGSAQSIDTLKAMQSLAQGAVLSGKNLQLYYNACSNGLNYFYAIDLVR